MAATFVRLKDGKWGVKISSRRHNSKLLSRLRIGGTYGVNVSRRNGKNIRKLVKVVSKTDSASFCEIVAPTEEQKRFLYGNV